MSHWGIRSWLLWMGVDLVPRPFWHRCGQGSCNQALRRSMPSCCLNAGNLIMAAVIYSSHGSYLAPADLMGRTEGEIGGGDKGNDWDWGGGQCLPWLAELKFKPEIRFNTVKWLPLEYGRTLCVYMCEVLRAVKLSQSSAPGEDLDTTNEPFSLSRHFSLAFTCCKNGWIHKSILLC